ncbi:ThiF family protein [Pilibacter termitis]|uniref:ThiF family protein n=1 Tax=Pilibacter termitis TaxID=263852 RepID=A0A1T4LJV7_9ENTE|nr:ThiF family adenylyltransferase [Pilibacter termitis]SJZ54906.1 ThiF family protein [Pilibacter termitis]
MKLKTNLTAQLVKTSTDNIIGVGTKQYFTTSDEFKNSVDILQYLTKEREYEEVTDFLRKNNLSEKELQKLLDHKLITSNQNIFHKKDEMSFKNELYLELVVENANMAINDFKDTTFIILGCGGIGNFMAFALSTFSPKKIVLIDGEKIERSNLNRQFLFSNNDIGEFKATVIKRELKKRNPSLSIDVRTEWVDSRIGDELIRKYGHNNCIGILSADSTLAVQGISKSFCKKNVPFINIGYLNDISLIGPFYIPKISCCPYCHNAFSLDESTIGDENDIEYKIKQINDMNSAPSVFSNNALSASLAMSDIVQYIAGNFQQVKSVNKRIGVNSSTFEMYSLSSSIDETCQYCGEQ